MAKSKNKKHQQTERESSKTLRGSSSGQESFDEAYEMMMDGAQFWANQRDKTPYDFLTNEQTGKRPGQTKEPFGEVLVSLRGGIMNSCIPPRFVWDHGHWESVNPADGNKYDTWVVSGEGTPGNYLERKYLLPPSIAYMPEPDHPADWPDDLKRGSVVSQRSKTTTSTPPKKSPVPISAGSGLPFGVRALCVGCGHYFKIDDLTDHVKAEICPAVQGDLALFIIPCSCCETLQQTAKVIEGFPYKPKQTVSATDDAEKEEEVKA